MKNADMPAMPVFNSNGAPVHWSNGGLENYGVMCGLTKRETMAMHMMASIQSSGGLYDRFESMANDAVSMADALLSELERKCQKP